jgi:glycosyltransferase involved in cell wall biosynthesis
MNVIHVADFMPPFPGSFVAMLRAAVRATRHRGWGVEVALVAPDVERPAWLAQLAADVSLTVIPSRNRRGVGRWLSGRVGSPSTIVHSHFARFDLPALVAARTRRASVLWHVHNRPPRHARGFAKFGLLSQGVDSLLCVTREIKDDVLRLGARRGSVLYLPNAVDTSMFAPSSGAARRRARAELGVGESEPVLVHFGGDWARKGGDLLVEALNRFGDRAPTVLAIGAGENASSHPRLRRVDAGAVSPQCLFAAADALVAPSRSEGMPLAVIEAVCAGVPVIASEIPGHATVLAGVGSSRLTPLAPQPLADAMIAFFGQPLDRAQSGRDANLMHARYDVAGWSSRLMAVYDSILDGRAAR